MISEINKSIDNVLINHGIISSSHDEENSTITIALENSPNIIQINTSNDGSINFEFHSSNLECCDILSWTCDDIYDVISMLEHYGIH